MGGGGVVAVTLDDIADRLGVATPDLVSPQGKQWSKWIGDAEALIGQRADRLFVPVTELDPEQVDRVVELAVTAMARKPDDATTVDVSVDDGRVARTYKSSTGRVVILDEWWFDLGLGDTSGAFSTRPGFEPGAYRVFDSTTSRGFWL